ncbi:hypothetical protein KO465_03000 [Candidatus Micrarchaeota archaeon]|nr:hypothetical protein [Candidatus Micrarchaeota archaeon]
MKMEYGSEINEAWKKTCKILLGEDIGDIKEYKTFLHNIGCDPLIKVPSQISNKEVHIATNKYFCKKAKFISNDEREMYDGKMRDLKIDLNNLKDIDSLVNEVSEHFYYAGDIILGNSKNIIRSNKITNCFNVYDSVLLNECKYIAFCTNTRDSEYVFGHIGSSELKFCIGGFDNLRIARSFETIASIHSSDCLYSANIIGCNDCVFSFNQRNKQHLVGNNSLSKEKYRQIKEKLVEDVKEIMKTKKEFPTLVDIMGD